MHHTQVSEVRIHSSLEIAPGIFLLGFPRSFDFLPGQVIGIGLQKDGPRRLYSICSGNQDPEVLILYNVVQEGYLTPRLSTLNIGDTIWITEPRGDFLYQDGPGMWIATGTGIAPFYSMLRSGNHKEKKLVHGERYPDRFCFSNEFSETLGKSYIRCCSRDTGPGLFHGRVTDYLEQKAHLPTDINYYLCGRAEMVVEVRDLLIRRGVSFERILSEIYF